MLNRKSFLSCLIVCCIAFVSWPDVSSAATAKDKFIRADVCYKKLRNSSKKQKFRDNWISCIKKYQNVYRHDPSGPWAAAGLYQSGVLYHGLYKRSRKKSDLQEARDIFKRIINRFPKSQYREKATKAIRNLQSQKTVRRAAGSEIKKKPPATRKKKDPPVSKTIQTPVQSSIAIVTGLRFWSNPNYTRIVIDANKETSYTHRLLKRDLAIAKPQRLYVDLRNSMMGKDTQKTIPINDNLLSDARAGQHSPDSVRVVVDIKSYTTYKIFSLKNPFRIVLDVWGDTTRKQTRSKRYKPKEKNIPPSALVKQLVLGVNRIVIDPGHGGRDFGAPGYLKGVHEKNVALKISKKLAKKIREKLKCEVILTRTKDKFLTLEERTAIANTKNADLFISIHTNASRDRRAFGIETYFLNLATDDDAILVAARENATSTKNISDLQTILDDLMHNAKVNESSRLAAQVQISLYKHLKTKRYSRIKNLGVKQAPFYVLLGAQMPAILIETSFISNARECKRLINSRYQDYLVDGILKGILNYIRETNPMALSKSS